MSDYNNLTANLQVATLNTANIGVGRYILNDYVIEIIEAEDGNGYTMNIRKGSQVQTMHLTELTPEYVNQLINDGLRTAKASGEFDGFSPIASVEDSVIGAKITITDKNGTTTEYVRDGRDGKDGVDGFSPTVRAIETADGIAVTATQKDGTFDIVHVNDGYSPTANVAKNGDTQVITITDKNGTTTADILDGVGISSAVLDESTYQLTLYFTDGTSYTTQPIRGQKGDTGPQGLKGDPGESFNLHVCVSSEYDENTGLPIISNPESNTMYLVPAEREEQGDLFVEWVYVNRTWEMFGSASVDLSQYAKIDDTAGVGDTDKAWSADKITSELANAGTVQDVTIDGTSVVSNGIAEIPIANNSGGLGIVCFDATKGVGIGSATNAATIVGATSVDIKVGTHNYSPIVPSHQHESTFYGLAKAAGDSTQSASSNAVGTYTEDAKSAIKQMFGVIDPVSEIDDTAGAGDIDKTWSADKISSELANAGSVQDVTVNGVSIVDENGNAAIPKATNISLGLVKGSNSIDVLSSGTISVIPATETMVKELSDNDRAVTSGRLTNGVFYGLAKAAGDTTQASSDNAVGTYTDEAKSAIKAMLGVIDPESKVVTVTGTDPVIQAEENTRYMCGEVLSLSFTPSASGICEVIFTAGSTLPVITLPATVKMPEWFEIETDHTYEISIVDGVYGAVMVW